MEPQEDTGAYSEMASIIQTAFEQLLAPLERLRNPTQLLESTTAEVFFQDFLIQAAGFAEKTSQEFAKTLRQFSSVPEVRGTPTTELAKKIRDTCFEKVDRILTSYVEALKDLNLNFSVTSSQIAESSAVGAALHGAAVGQLAGGLGRAGKNIGTFSAIWSGAGELLKQGALAEQQLALLKRARQLPYEKIAAFLEAAAGLPEELLDYGCARCFGGQVDFARQREALELVSCATSSKLKEAITLVRTLPAVEEELMQKKAAVEAVKVEEKQRQESKQGYAGCLGGLAVVSLLVGMVVFGEEESMIDFTPLILGSVIAVVLVIAAIWLHPTKPKKDGAGATVNPPVTIPKPDKTKTKTQLLNVSSSAGTATVTIKKCDYCGKEYPNDATVCAVDGRPLISKNRTP